MARTFRIVTRTGVRVAFATTLFGGCAVAVATLAVSPGVGRADQQATGIDTAAAPSVEPAPVRVMSAQERAALSKLTMPGRRRWSRNEVVSPAIAALGYLMRVENADDATYLAMRAQVTDSLAAQLAVDPARLAKAWSRAPRDHQLALLAAVSQLGVPYVEGKEDPHVRMDCSGLLWFAWRVAGVDAPRVSTAQLDPRMRISSRDAIAGDIAGEGKHVHMYLGVPKAFIHAPYSGRLVRLKIMKDSQWNRVAWTNPSNIATYRL